MRRIVRGDVFIDGQRIEFRNGNDRPPIRSCNLSRTRARALDRAGRYILAPGLGRTSAIILAQAREKPVQPDQPPRR